MRISACLIVKDEERCLQRCLESLRGQVDEIIVVDTGSIDRTVAITREFTDRVVHFSWVDDFAAARNCALDAATGEWVLSIDADEWLAAGAGPALRAAVAGADPDVYALNVHIANLDLDGEHMTVTHGTRLFRLEPGVRWQNRIHESIVDLTGAGRRVLVSDVQFFHDGYLNRVRQEKGKNQRNLALLLDDMRRQPQAKLASYISNEYWALDDWEASLRWARKAIALRGRTELSHSLTSRSMHNIVASLLELGRYGDARRHALAALELFPDYADLQYLCGLAYSKEERWEDALVTLDRCLAMGQPDQQRYWSMEGSSTVMPHVTMGPACEALDQREAAVHHYTAALAMSGGRNLDATCKLAELLCRHEGGAAALQFINDRVGLTLHIAGALVPVFLRAGALAEAATCWEVLRQNGTCFDPPSAAMWELYHGRYAEAARHYAAAAQLTAGAPGGKAVVACLLAPDSTALAAVVKRMTAPWRTTARAMENQLQAGAVPSLSAREGAVLVSLLESVLQLPQAASAAATPLLEALFTLAHACQGSLAFDLGRELMRAGCIDMALPYLQKAVQERPRSPEVLGELATALERQGQFRDAAACFSRGVELAPGKYAWHRGTIRSLIKCGLPDLARTAAQRAANAFPESHWLACLVAGTSAGYGLLDISGDGVIDYSQLNSLSRETEGLAR